MDISSTQPPPSEESRSSALRGSEQFVSPFKTVPAGAGPPVASLRAELSRIRDDFHRGRYEQAETSLLGLLGAIERAGSRAAGDEEVELKRLGAAVYTLIGRTHWRLGEVEESKADFERAFALYQELLGKSPPPMPEDYKDYGITLQRTGREEEAVGVLRNAVEGGIDDAETHRYLGVALTRSGDYSAGVSSLLRALEMSPKDPEAFRALAENFEAQGRLEEAADAYAAAAAQDSGHPDRALDTINEALRVVPGHADALATKARVLFALGRLDEALIAADQAYAAKPSAGEALITKAAILSSWGRLEEVLQVVDQILGAKPDWPPALAIKAEAFRAIGRYADAAEVVDRALEGDPENVLALGTKAELLRMQGRHTESLEIADRALTGQPDSIFALSTKAAALSGLDRLDEAIEVADRALAHRLDNPFLLAIRADALRRKGQLEEALQSSETALSFDPDLDLALGVKGEVLRRLGQLDDALSALDEALRVNPQYLFAQKAKGDVLRSMGRNEEAVQILERVLEAGPDAYALKSKGEAHLALGQFDDALAALDQALQLTPEDPSIWRSKHSVLQALGDFGGAADALARAVDLEPRSAAVDLELGEALRMAGRAEEALQVFDRGLGQSPHDIQLLRSKAYALVDLSRIQEGIAVIEGVADLAPDDAIVAGDRALFRLYGDDPEGAWEAVTKAIGRWSDSSWARIVETLFFMQTGEYQQSLRAATRATSVDPNNPWTHALRALALQSIAIASPPIERRGQALECEREYREALRLDPQQAIWRAGLAETLYLQGSMDAAAEAFEDALAALEAPSAPLSGDTLNSRGWCLFRLGRFEGAVKLYIEALSADPKLFGTQFNLALASMANGQAALGVREYERGVSWLQDRHPLSRRGFLKTAINDLQEAIEAGTFEDRVRPPAHREEKRAKEVTRGRPTEAAQAALEFLQRTLRQAVEAAPLPGQPA